MTDHWSERAQSWKQDNLPPLQPAGPELGLITRWLRQFEASGQSVAALLLGVTPEYCTLPWPPASQVLAVDHSQSMIDTVWPGRRDQVVCADWLALPLAAASRNFVLCDGGVCLQPYPQQQQQLVRAVARVMQPGGIAIIRNFVLPEYPMQTTAESIDKVMHELRSGAISSLSELKLRLWVLLQTSSTTGITSHEFWEVVKQATSDWDHIPPLLTTEVGQRLDRPPTAPARTFYLARNSEIVSWFCTAPGGFKLEETLIPPHAQGQLCPSLVLRRL